MKIKSNFIAGYALLVVLLTNYKITNGQGCSGLNIQFKSDISSLCNYMVMTMAHDKESKPFLYVANKEAGLKIYDVSNLSLPTLSKTIPNTSFGALDVMNLKQQGNYLYLALGNHFSNNQASGIAIVDVSDPSKAAVTDFWILPDSVGGAGVIEVEGDYAYLGAMKNGLVILDISNKNNIVFRSRIIPNINYPTVKPNPNLYNARGLAVKNGIVYLCFDAGGIRIINTTNKNTPMETGHFSNPLLNGYARAYNNVTLHNNLLYVAVDYCGVEILDVTDTSKIKMKGKWNPYNCPSNNWFNTPVHANELYLDTSCKLLYLSTGKSDMMVLDVSNPAVPDSCNAYGGVGNNIGTWGIGVYESHIYLSYVCSIIPFSSNWTGVKILSYTPCNKNSKAKIKTEEVFKIYPSPSNKLLKIEFSNPNLKVGDAYFQNVLGQTYRLESYSNSINQFDVSELPAGVYFLNLEQGGIRYSAKILISR